MPEPVFSATYKGGFGTPKGEEIEVETDGLHTSHSGVLNAWAGAILRGEPLVAEGTEGINGLTLSNAMHLSAFLGKEVTLPLDEDLYYEELMKRDTTKRKVQIDTYFSRELVSVLREIDTLPDEFANDIAVYEQKAKLNPPMEKRAKMISVSDVSADVSRIENEILGWSVVEE